MSVRSIIAINLSLVVACAPPEKSDPSVGDSVAFDDSVSLGAISEEVILAYERKLNAKLPPGYRDYLLQHNGGIPIKARYWMPNGKQNWIETVDRMYGLGEESNVRSLSRYLNGDYGIPSGWIPIADSGYGDYTVISVRDEDYGHVYYLFHEEHGYDASNRTEGVYHLGKSFAAWIESLDEIEEEE